MSDRPGGLSELLRAVSAADGNVLQVAHVRDGVVVGVGQTGIELTLAARSPEHASALIDELGGAGHQVERL